MTSSSPTWRDLVVRRRRSRRSLAWVKRRQFHQSAISVRLEEYWASVRSGLAITNIVSFMQAEYSRTAARLGVPSLPLSPSHRYHSHAPESRRQSTRRWQPACFRTSLRGGDSRSRHLLNFRFRVILPEGFKALLARNLGPNRQSATVNLDFLQHYRSLTKTSSTARYAWRQRLQSHLPMRLWSAAFCRSTEEL